jgi:hypothetical protein
MGHGRQDDYMVVQREYWELVFKDKKISTKVTNKLMCFILLFLVRKEHVLPSIYACEFWVSLFFKYYDKRTNNCNIIIIQSKICNFSYNVRSLIFIHFKSTL